MVYGYYPNANAVAQPFRIPVNLNETGVPAALTGMKVDRRLLDTAGISASSQEAAGRGKSSWLLLAEDYPRFRQIVRRQLDGHFVPGHDTDEMLPHFTRNMSQDIALAGQINAEHRPR
jgi:hypothetical protein